MQMGFARLGAFRLCFGLWVARDPSSTKARDQKALIGK
jgi:hypothetical protein